MGAYHVHAARMQVSQELALLATASRLPTVYHTCTEQIFHPIMTHCTKSSRWIKCRLRNKHHEFWCGWELKWERGQFKRGGSILNPRHRLKPKLWMISVKASLF